MSHIKMEHITKQFPGVVALNDVSVEFEEGTITALCGENGAGKSTLGKVLAGIYDHKSYDGAIYIRGRQVYFRNTLDAEKEKIVLVHQELNLIPDLTVEENVFLGDYPVKFGHVDYDEMTRRTLEIFKELEIQIDPKETVRNLSTSLQQMVEITKAIARDPEVVIFDEATSSLAAKEIHTLFAIMRKLKAKGVTILYVSHKLEEIFEVCDRVVILKDGSYVNEAPVAEIDRDKLITWMVGHSMSDQFPPHDKDLVQRDKVLFEVRNWNVYKTGTNKADQIKTVDNLSFHVCAGEVVGLYGLMGAGRTRLLNSMFDSERYQHDGQIFVNGKEVKNHTALDSIKCGLGYVTEDRRKTGLCLIHSVSENILLASLRNYANRVGCISDKKGTAAQDEMVKKLGIKVADINSSVAKLSGGNQQKVIFAKWLLNNPHVLLLDEPTRGIDVGAKKEIYSILRKLSEAGVGVVLVSSEIPEVMGVSDRILVVKGGKIAAEIDRSEATEELLLKNAIGG
ncbi:sugar ABC transporter ATP-binding protein [Agathobaculum sp.]|uniref:sugar ABC transporter ATP-binding protein n=1 Tax=Agathobaculum sp. TaxID=2048138 RepID=UPI002A8324B8|nr:sugar ABC transporter ATP-binding protein [Agathobaculum sp.]MDY3619424.1 sugar ABC transporter ATP-binding protein [Agathobaculum sp.]